MHSAPPSTTDSVGSITTETPTTLSLDDPNRFVVTQNFYSAEADAPFPAAQFQAETARGIVTPEWTYLITSGRLGFADGATAGYYLEVMPTGKINPATRRVVAISDCIGFASLLPGDVTDPTAVPYQCDATGEIENLDLVAVAAKPVP